MEHATAISAKNVKALVAVMVVAASVGVAMFLRDPDTSALPMMAEHPVVMPDGASLYVQKYEVSVAEWNACYDAGDCAFRLRVPVQDEMPATGLSFIDAMQYLDWINDITGQTFRLPTVQEWAHMADEVLHTESDPIFNAPELSWASTYLMEEQTPRS
jgi:formylglycine-generating enzyme required for sulfatase activity